MGMGCFFAIAIWLLKNVTVCDGLNAKKYSVEYDRHANKKNSLQRRQLPTRSRMGKTWQDQTKNRERNNYCEIGISALQIIRLKPVF